MNRSILFRAVLFSIVVSICCLSARAGEMLDNPKYQAWSKFKEGSSNTVSADIVRGQNTIHVETKRTLISVSPDNVVVETATTATAMGHDHVQPPTRETINAKTDTMEFKQTGEKDIEAMGKTFKCKVYESNPAAQQPGGAAAANKGTAYSCDDVPGGLVKLDVTGANGVEITFILTAMEAK